MKDCYMKKKRNNEEEVCLIDYMCDVALDLKGYLEDQVKYKHVKKGHL